MTTDTTALQERIRRARSLPAEWARCRDGETAMEQAERWQKRQDEQTAALIAAEVQAAKADALREAAFHASDISKDGTGGNDWFPEAWAGQVAGYLEARARRVRDRRQR